MISFKLIDKYDPLMVVENKDNRNIIYCNNNKKIEIWGQSL